MTPTVESIREFKVLTGIFSAEFGRGAGVVSVSTKSGNNEFHGTAFEYVRNERFDAKNYFALPTAKKAPLDRHQYGASLSGPLFKNKTFFFFDYAGQREDRGQIFVNTVPTAATRRGDFSNYVTGTETHSHLRSLHPTNPAERRHPHPLSGKHHPSTGSIMWG